nr:hypothetical protein [Pseudomonas syringae pv. actinidiae]
MLSAASLKKAALGNLQSRAHLLPPTRQQVGKLRLSTSTQNKLQLPTGSSAVCWLTSNPLFRYSSLAMWPPQSVAPEMPIYTFSTARRTPPKKL